MNAAMGHFAWKQAANVIRGCVVYRVILLELKVPD